MFNLLHLQQIILISVHNVDQVVLYMKKVVQNAMRVDMLNVNSEVKVQKSKVTIFFIGNNGGNPQLCRNCECPFENKVRKLYLSLFSVFFHTRTNSRPGVNPRC